MDVAVDQMLSFRAEVGARLNSAKVAKDAIGIVKIQKDGHRSKSRMRTHWLCILISHAINKLFRPRSSQLLKSFSRACSIFCVNLMSC